MNFAALDLNLLRVFDAMMIEGSTVRAGERLGLSQPAVSSALGRLRHVVGDRLFVRDGNRMVPTAKSLQLHEPLRDALRRMHEALSAAAGFDPATSQRTFRLNGSDYFSSLLMPRLAVRLAETAPAVVLQMLDHPGSEVFRLLSEGTCDVAVNPALETPEWIAARKLLESYVICVAQKSHPILSSHGVEPGTRIPPDLFCAIPHVMASMDGSLVGSVDTMLRKHGLSRRIAMTVPHFHAVALACTASPFLGNLPVHFAHLAARDLDLDLYLTPFEPLRVGICLFWHRSLDLDPANMWLRDEIESVLGLDEDRIPAPS